MNRTKSAAFFLFAAIVTTPALAEEQVWQTGDGFTVRTTGLDLGRSEGRAALLRRVEYAATRICRHVIPRRTRGQCAEGVMERALASTPPNLRMAVATARMERQTRQLAARR